jgi:putative ABC transport system permease protein
MRIRTLLTRQWRDRPGRALATAASVAMAVGAVVATWAAADASRAGYRRLSAAMEGAPSLVVAARDGRRFDSAMVPKLADVPGVRAVVPLFFRPTLLRLGERRVREIAVGVDAEGLVAAGLLELTAGEPCRTATEAVLDAGLAASLGLGVGDEVLFFARRRIRRLTVTGLAHGASLRWFAEGAGVVVDIGALGSMSLAEGQLDRVRLALAPGADREAVLEAVSARLPQSLVAEVPAGMQRLAQDVMHSANLGLDFVTGLTVAMAWFIVGNAVLMNVTERRRGFALVRLLGATARQVRRFVTGEAALLGLAGAIVGAVAGLLAARPIAAGIARALQAPDDRFTPHPAIVPAAMAVAVLVTIAAAWWPAREAAAVDPLEGLRAAPPPPPRRVSWRLVAAAIGLGTIAEGVLALVMLEWLPPRASVPAGILLLLTFVALTPLVLPGLVRLLARLVPRRFRTERALAVEQILRQPVRTALTAGVLVVAVTNGIGLGHSIRDNVDDILGWYARTLRADWLLTRAGLFTPSAAGQDPRQFGLQEAVAAVDGVAAVEAVAVTPGRVAGGVCLVVARDVPASGAIAIQPVGATAEEARAALTRGEALAGTMLARRTGLEAGDEISVEVAGRTTRVRVAALIVDYTAGGASLHVSREAGRRLFGLEGADILLVTAATGRTESLRAPLAAIAADHAMLLRSFGDLQKLIDSLVQGVVGSLWSILGLGFVVGSLGVANTVTMSVLEKRRVLGLLRAVGMRDGQVVRMVLLESVLVGAAAGLIGAVGGLVTAAFIQLASQPLLGHPVAFRIRPGVVAANVVAAVVVTALASWLPARRAVRLDLLESIAAE